MNEKEMAAKEEALIAERDAKMKALKGQICDYFTEAGVSRELLKKIAPVISKDIRTGGDSILEKVSDRHQAAVMRFLEQGYGIIEDYENGCEDLSCLESYEESEERKAEALGFLPH